MWQLALVGYFVFGAAAYLTRRKLMARGRGSPRVFNLIFWTVFCMPSGWIIGSILPHNLAVGWENALLLAIGASFWPLVSLISFRVSREVDAGFYALTGNLAPLVTLAIAVTLLRETVSRHEATGIALLILSGVIIAIPLLKGDGRASRYGFFLCMLGVLFGGIGVAYESWMLSRVGLGSYMILAWTMSAVWSVLLARGELRRIPEFFRHASRQARRLVVVFGVSNVLRTVCFLAALFLSGSAAIIGAATNFLAVAVLIAAFLILRERQHLPHKLAAAVVGIAGLFLVAS